MQGKQVSVSDLKDWDRSSGAKLFHSPHICRRLGCPQLISSLPDGSLGTSEAAIYLPVVCRLSAKQENGLLQSAAVSSGYLWFLSLPLFLYLNVCSSICQMSLFSGAARVCLGRDGRRRRSRPYR